MELSNNAELKAKFVTRIDGEFWIEIRYTRDFHFSRENPAPLTEFSASYTIKQNDNIVQKGGFGLGAKVPSLMSRPYYGALLGKFMAKKGAEYEVTIRLGADVPNGLPKSATVDISLDPRVPYSWSRGWWQVGKRIRVTVGVSPLLIDGAGLLPEASEKRERADLQGPVVQSFLSCRAESRHLKLLETLKVRDSSTSIGMTKEKNRA